MFLINTMAMKRADKIVHKIIRFSFREFKIHVARMQVKFFPKLFAPYKNFSRPDLRVINLVASINISLKSPIISNRSTDKHT